MIQVIPARQREPSFGEQLGSGLGGGISQGFSRSQEAARRLKGEEAAETRRLASEKELVGLRGEEQRKNFEHEFGIKAPHELKKQEEEYGFKKEIEQLKAQQAKVKFENKLIEHETKAKEKIAPLQSGLNTVEKMREIRSKGNLGFGTGITRRFGGEDARDAAEYEQLGKSLIALSTTIPIRNRLEFETLAENLYDPTITDAAAEGILDAMEHILSQGLQEHTGEIRDEVLKDYEEIFGEEKPEESEKKVTQKSKRPPLTSFHR